MKIRKITALFLAVISLSSFSITAYATPYTTDDVITVLRATAGLITPTDEQINRLDMNSDGIIDTSAAIHILRAAAGFLDIDNGENIDTSKIILSNNYISSEHFQDDFVKMNISNNTLSIEYKTARNGNKWHFTIFPHFAVIEEGYLNNNHFSRNVSLSSLNNGAYAITFFVGSGDDYSFSGTSTVKDIPLHVINGTASFLESPMLQHNIRARNIGLSQSPNDYLSIDDLSDSEKTELTNLVKTIIGNETDDYKKLKLISDWVADNIYYDWAAYIAGTYTHESTRAYATYVSKKNVCQGYAELTNVLMRLAGLPCRVISGHALGASAGGKGWSDVIHTSINHAWNEVYVNGRWVILDTTWISANEYINGEFIKKDNDYTYFDPTIEVFSRSHKYLSYS